MPSHLTPRVNIWLEANGEVAVSLWRIQLLQTVDRLGSITAAAEALNVPYRLAWKRVHEMEQRLGVTLVHTSAGGRGGGGSSLTPFARNLIDRFQVVTKEVEDFATEQCRLHIGDLHEQA